MNDKCWECNKVVGQKGGFGWEIPCECGALNFVKVCGHCYYTSENTDPLLCRICDERPLLLSSIVKDEEDIL